MISLREEITVPRSVEDCFRYVADFRSVTEWDATAQRCQKVSQGPIGLGLGLRSGLPSGADVHYPAL